MAIYLSRIGNGVNFNNSKQYEIWGYNKNSKKIISNMKKDDIIIFIENGGGSNVKGIARFENYKDINDEPLINIHTIDNVILCWTDYEKYPIQIKYTNFKNLNNLEIHNFKGQTSIRIFDNKKHKFICKNNLIDIETLISILY